MSTPFSTDLENLQYVPGLSRIEEAVISSHFMEELAQDQTLQLYGAEKFDSACWKLNDEELEHELIPLLVNASFEFARERAELALPRARQHFQRYGLANPNLIRIEHEITEALFDKQYLRGPRETCSREQIALQIKALIDKGATIRLVIPALPFKFSSPLKSKGHSPDLGEVNFLLSLAETVRTVEQIYRRLRPDEDQPLVQFVVISDGSRFNQFVGEPHTRLSGYRAEIITWIQRLKLDSYIQVVDYSETLRQHLSPEMLDEKAKIASSGRDLYAKRMWPIFDPHYMSATLRRAIEVEPDPEMNNPEGRFVTLLKSLVYTINYRSLQDVATSDSKSKRDREFEIALYRELTTHLFRPYVHPHSCAATAPSSACALASLEFLESLRVQMLREVWECTIEYLAEIKSDRELPVDPILAAFPECIRWTIHAKPGQLALLTAHALGAPIQCWAGTGTFRASKRGKVRLCTLPVLALEGNGASPVILTTPDGKRADQTQPLFYVDKRIPAASMSDLFTLLKESFSRRRTS